MKKNLDNNSNEACLGVNEEQSVETSACIFLSVPVQNSFEALAKPVQDTIDGKKEDKNIKEHPESKRDEEERSSELDAKDIEVKIREKIKISIKNKMGAKLASNLLTEAEALLLEEVLVNDMEETISEEVAKFKLNLYLDEDSKHEENDNDELSEGPVHNFYWGEEGEIIFTDD